MALNVQPFLSLAATKIATAGSTTTTMTFDTTVVPYGSVRVANIGTAVVFIQFIDTTNTTTVGITNAQPVINNTAVVLNPGGKAAMAMITASTFTTTIFATAGTGGMAR